MSFSVACSVLLLAALASLPACSARSAANEPAGAREAGGVRVELDLFSGRPNPTWELSQQQGKELWERLARLPRVADATFPDHLGYRGIVAELPGPDGGNESIRIYGGAVRHQTQGATLFLNDADRQLERWLAETGAPHLEPGVYQSVLNELGAR
jgi:hypothetical protein